MLPTLRVSGRRAPASGTTATEGTTLPPDHDVAVRIGAWRHVVSVTASQCASMVEQFEGGNIGTLDVEERVAAMMLRLQTALADADGLPSRYAGAVERAYLRTQRTLEAAVLHAEKIAAEAAAEMEAVGRENDCYQCGGDPCGCYDRCPGCGCGPEGADGSGGPCECRG